MGLPRLQVRSNGYQTRQTCRDDSRHQTGKRIELKICQWRDRRHVADCGRRRASTVTAACGGKASSNCPGRFYS